MLLHRQFYCFESATKTSKPIAKPTNAGLMFWLFMATSKTVTPVCGVCAIFIIASVGYEVIS